MNALYRFRCKLWNKILFRNSRHYLPRWLMNCVRARTVALYRVLTVKCRRRNGDVCSTCFVTCVPIVLCVYQICLMDARVPMVSGILLLTVYSTTWRRVLLEKLTGFQLIKKFPAFYGTWRFIPAFTSARHLSLSWASSMQSIPPHPTSWRSILMLSSHLRLGLPSGLFPSGFPTKTLYRPLLSPTRATCLAHLILVYLISRTIFGGQYKSLSFSLCSFLHYPVTSSLLGANIFLKTLFSNSLSLRSSHNVNDQVSHPYKTTGKISSLYLNL